MTKKQNQFNNGNWDKEGSTYMQIIRFSTGNELIGYSKKNTFHERNDKIQVITNFIMRMYRDGYLDPKNSKKSQIDCIEYYETATGSHLISCYYKTFEIVEEAIIESDYWKPLLDFLGKFYGMIDRGRSVTDIYDKLYVKTRTKSKDPLETEKKRFIDWPSLRKYAEHILETKQAEQGAIENFIIKYSEKHFGVTPTIDRRSKEPLTISKFMDK